jgi:hypothetical protein
MEQALLRQQARVDRPPSSRRCIPREERTRKATTQPPKGLLSLRKVPDLRPAWRPSCRQRSGTGTLPGLALPGRPRKVPCAACRTTRALRSAAPGRMAALGAPPSRHQCLRVEGRSFRSACSLFPVACASRLGRRPLLRRALGPSPRACRRSRQRAVETTRCLRASRA